MIKIYNEDCIKGAKVYIKDNSVDLIICDPPFGIGETKFEGLYNRKNNIIDGYVEAPKDYNTFSKQWVKEAERVLKENGTLYIFSGWSNLYDILDAIKDSNLLTLNQIIWKYNFCVFAKKKFISSHYHVLRVAKQKADLTFNTYCRFGPQEKASDGKSLLNIDLEDVFLINKEYSSGEVKNNNKLPLEIINKLILYSSNEGDLVSDFFLGNFTTAFSAKGLNRDFVGFELNESGFKHHSKKLQGYEEGCLTKKLKQIKVELPKNQGNKITNEEVIKIKKRFSELLKTEKTKKSIIEILMKEFERGKFSIINILKR